MRIAAAISVDELTGQGVDWAPLRSVLAQLRACGCDGVELAVRDPDLIDQAALERVLGAAGLPVAALATGTAYSADGLSFTHPDPAIRREAWARIAAHCRLAAGIGGRVILGLVRGRVQPGVERAQAEAWMREGVLAACEAAQQLGVALLFEPINRYETDLVHTAEEGVALLEELAAENLGLLLDTYHMNIEEPHILASLIRAGQHLRHVHAADSNRRYPGAGHIDFRAVVAVLRALGYDGYLSAEILPWPDLLTSLCRAATNLRHLLAGASDAGGCRGDPGGRRHPPISA